MTAPLDAAYEILGSTAPEYGPLGLSNHGPMAVEALAAAGRDASILPWLERYAKLLDPKPEASRAISSRWEEALGHVERHADWAAFFDDELRSGDWRAVVRTWSARLAPGLSGGALHGLLRACHAVRAVQRADTPLRRRELAQGLAYWAACYYSLPGERVGGGSLSPEAALARLELLPEADRPGFGLITVALGKLATFTPFASAGGLLDDTSRPPDEVLSDMTETFASAYLANVTPTNLIALIHMVTGPSAIRLLLPHVDAATARLLVAHAWQAGCALFTVFATTTQAPSLTAPPPSADDLLDRAIANGDEHAIKMTEACLREEAARPSLAFRAAADDVIRRSPQLRST